MGVGFAWDKEKVRVVEIFAQKPLQIKKLTDTEDGGVEVEGRMLVPLGKAGIYAGAITFAKNLKKDVKIVGPPNIQFDKATGNFAI